MFADFRHVCSSWLKDSSIDRTLTQWWEQPNTRYVHYSLVHILVTLVHTENSSYCKNPKYWDILTPHRTCPKNLNNSIGLPIEMYENCQMSGKQCRPWLDAILQCLIQVYTVCPNLSVPILRNITVLLKSRYSLPTESFYLRLMFSNQIFWAQLFKALLA